ncbi:MAG: porin, partial [Defluviicoccus sp.]
MLGLVPTAPMAAEERIRVRIGGTMQQWAVAADQNINTGDGTDFDTAALDQKHNSEIRFLGEAELRNEVTIGFRIELEANTDDQQIGESFLFVEHPTAGLIQIGDTDSSAVNMHVAAPDGGISINDGDLLGIEAFITPEGYEEGNTLIDSTALQLGDDNSGKFSYYTPRFAGVQIGVSYIPRFEDGGSNNDSITRVDSEGPVRDGVAIAVNY